MPLRLLDPLKKGTVVPRCLIRHIAWSFFAIDKRSATIREGCAQTKKFKPLPRQTCSNRGRTRPQALMNTAYSEIS
jgi:hypothetical protein